MNQIEFFIDTYNRDAYRYILEKISLYKSSEVEEKFRVTVVNVHEDEDCETHYFYLKGSWDAYKIFLQKPEVDLNLPEHRKYSYSITHYED